MRELPIAVVMVGAVLAAVEHGVQRSGPSFAGTFIHAAAVRGDLAARDCLSLGENLFTDDVREVGMCQPVDGGVVRAAAAEKRA